MGIGGRGGCGWCILGWCVCWWVRVCCGLVVVPPGCQCITQGGYFPEERHVGVLGIICGVFFSDGMVCVCVGVCWWASTQGSSSSWNFSTTNTPCAVASCRVRCCACEVEVEVECRVWHGGHHTGRKTSDVLCPYLIKQCTLHQRRVHCSCILKLHDESNPSSYKFSSIIRCNPLMYWLWTCF